MQTSINMGLVEWTADSDDFSSAQLATNFALIDTHNHSAGQGVQVPTAGIQNNAITTQLLAAGAVTNAILATNAVATTNVQDRAITTSKIAVGAVTGPVIPPGGVAYPQLDPTVLPLGTVALWWRPSGATTLPGGGWEIMDGRSWNTIPNNLGLTTGVIPDMRGAFALGADINGGVAPAIGLTGGSNTTNLAHAHTVAAHTHAIPNHGHTITPQPGHSHFFQNGNFLMLRQNCFMPGITVTAVGGVQRSNIYNSMFIGGYALDPNTQLPIVMDDNDIHDHGGTTGGYMGTTGSSTPATDAQLSNVTTTPQYTALLFIMRVR